MVASSWLSVLFIIKELLASEEYLCSIVLANRTSVVSKVRNCQHHFLLWKNV